MDGPAGRRGKRVTKGRVSGVQAASGEPKPLVAAAGVVLGGGTPSQTVHVALTAAQTALLRPGFDTCYSLLRANYGTPESPQWVTLQEDRWTVLPACEARE
jgi:hypothetical protein